MCSGLQRQAKPWGLLPPGQSLLRIGIPTWQDSSTRHETTQSTINEAYSRGEQTEVSSSPLSTSIQPSKPISKERPTREPYKGHPPVRKVTFQVLFDPPSI